MLRSKRIVTGLAMGLASLMAFGTATAFAKDTVAVGTSAPSFTLPSQDASPVSLADYKGKWVVLYFYPKDQTSGCSLEAHNFQRDLPKYEALHAVVLGVSLDTVDSHRVWCTKDSFTFKMLADPAHKVVDAYGVPVKTFQTKDGPMSIAMRDTFLISPSGKIVKEWEVKDIQGHSDEVLAAIQASK
ncbi:peroxiredoxin [Granulicella mallensis]|uniref:thioredoxin-dependent peroxiredoxin n=1 Tax=Granulicella mallensis (strain ATCC BAA-1857 / DSM 23137 / MP5ACTX8) TaxID=682795 RepID=G8P1I7_GRAMM|nr:peroxiredoxin [Granulicella mallensis]AEU34726.1 alkyl hydroperoxide reductase/ Thiol specific antioxidant/ Mal allergen [Granulicella mallensis MP5ACTX8]